jgi:hypothetical protein
MALKTKWRYAVMLCWQSFMLSVAKKTNMVSVAMLNVAMLNVNMVSVTMLSVMAPFIWFYIQTH